jgi:2-oxo-4-hydroxy-4-carboxy-5-ureidoimidazoline decarboxylase
MTLREINALDATQFTQALGSVFEHSPWIAARAHQTGPFATLDALHTAMVSAMHSASTDEQLALIHAHPELAGKAMMRQELTTASKREQSGAGLTECSSAEYQQLQDLNARYNAKFGFPFILAVAGYDRAGILAVFAARVERDRASELDEALTQIVRIARLRLEALIES